MKKVIFLVGVCIITLMSATLNAQVTIGKNQAPNPDAVLELVSPGNNKGFLPPRVTLQALDNPAPLSAHVAGMVVYNDDPADLPTGLYVNDGSKWVALTSSSSSGPSWFYMPSIPIDVHDVGTDISVNLWEEYHKQFNSAATGSQLVRSSTGAPAHPHPKIYAASELHYYVTGYSANVFSDVKLTATGMLYYTITSAGLSNVSDATYMNVVLVAK